MKLFCLSNGIIKKQNEVSLTKELFRKSIHLCTAFVPLLLKNFYWITEILLVLALCGYTVAEFLRLKGIEIPLISFITKTAARKRDQGKFVLGPVTLVLGIIVASLCFPEKDFTVGILTLAFGDGLASICGKLFGTVKIPLSGGKTCAGALSCFFAVFVSTFFVCNQVFDSLIIALIAMFIELLPMRDFDNFVIPVFVSLFASFLF